LPLEYFFNTVRKPLRKNVSNADVGCCVILLGCFR
jgi:hypothetical protein